MMRRLFIGFILALVAGLAAAQGSGRSFDHLKTGFALTGVHANERCESCHMNGIFKGTPRECSGCHTSGSRFARGNTVKPQRHVATQEACESCHNTQTFSGARFNHNGVQPGTCATCHNGAVSQGKPTDHLPTTASCDSCHRTSAWRPATGMNHSSFTAATVCTSCHNGSMATGRPANHIPSAGAICVACHSTNSWRPARWNHTQVVVANQCSTCHSGAFPPADGKPANHIPYQLVTGLAAGNCDSCHKSGFVAWTPARLHASVSLSTQCALCHSGSYPPAAGKPATTVHTGVTVCENCHRSTSSWTSVTFAHSPANAVGTGTCDTCHNGSSAKGKPANHIPVSSGTAKCDSCHRSQSSFTAAVSMNHSVVSTQSCKGCHNGSYLSAGTQGALAKPANHIPESQLLNGAAMDCNGCHLSTTSWGGARMNHNGSQGGGAGWCKSCHASGTAYLGSMEKKALTHERKTPPAIDCSESGCHRPLGTRGATYTKWD